MKSKLTFSVTLKFLMGHNCLDLSMPEVLCVPFLSIPNDDTLVVGSREQEFKVLSEAGN